MQSKTYNQDGLVNFAKMTKLAELVMCVLQYQGVGFNFEPKPDVSIELHGQGKPTSEIKVIGKGSRGLVRGEGRGRWGDGGACLSTSS